MERGEKAGETGMQGIPEPGNPPAILEIVEYIIYYAYKKKSREEIKTLLSEEYALQEIDTAFAFYEKFMI